MLHWDSICFGQRHPEFDYEDLELIKKISRLAKQHQRQCENSCNGYGIVKGQMYYTGMSYGQQPGEYERREYGYDVKSAYRSADDEETIFAKEINTIEHKIHRLIYQFNQEKYALWTQKPFKIDFQSDPRGNTVKLYYNEEYIELT